MKRICGMHSAVNVLSPLYTGVMSRVLSSIILHQQKFHFGVPELTTFARDAKTDYGRPDRLKIWHCDLRIAFNVEHRQFGLD